MQFAGHAHAQHRRWLAGGEVVAPLPSNRPKRPRGINAKCGMPGFEIQRLARRNSLGDYGYFRNAR